MPGAPSIANLRAMSDEELIALHDADAKYTLVGVAYYLDELTRRQQERQTREMVRLTWAIAALTLVVTIATLVNLFMYLSRG